MTEQYNQKDQTLLGIVETTPGTEETPSPANDAAVISNLRFAPQFEQDDGTTEHGGSLDAGDPIILGGGMTCSFDVRLKGSGTPATPPEWGKFLRGAACLQTITAVAVTGTAQGGAARAITLAAGEPATDDLYIAMPIRITSGPGAGERNFITGYNGTSKEATVARPWTVQPTATSQYSIDPNVRYSLASLDLSTLTLWGYMNANQAAVNSRLRKLIGGMGEMSLRLGPRTLPLLSFNFTGILPETPSNVARPSGIVFDQTQAPAYRGATSLIDGSDVKFQELQLSFGGTVGQAPDPAAAFGLDRASITARRVNGTISPRTRLNSVADFFADWQGQVKREMTFEWGDTDGNRLGLLLPGVRYNGNEEQEVEGIAHEAVGFQSTGFDRAFYLTTF